MVNRYGIAGAAERAVNRNIESMGYKMLVEMGWHSERKKFGKPESAGHVQTGRLDDAIKAYNESNIPDDFLKAA